MAAKRVFHGVRGVPVRQDTHGVLRVDQVCAMDDFYHRDSPEGRFLLSNAEQADHFAEFNQNNCGDDNVRDDLDEPDAMHECGLTELMFGRHPGYY